MICYIFLDIDGVLNDENYIRMCYQKNGGYAMHMNHCPFDPNALTNLMYLVQYVRAIGSIPKIILSSSWRLHEIDIEIIKARIAEYGLQITNKTPYLHQNRGKEIESFLESQKLEEEYSFVILDDESFDINTIFPNNLVLVNPEYGLSSMDVEKAKTILERSIL